MTDWFDTEFMRLALQWLCLERTKRVNDKELKKMLQALKAYVFLCHLSCTEVVQCKQPPVLTTHPTEGSWIHSSGANLRSC